jgi:23S rRNA (guanosine2251-2'-O)-methyltransferase
MAQEKVFGVHAVTAVLRSEPERVLALWLAAGKRPERLQRILQLAERAGITPQTCQKKQLDGWVSGNHQGVVADCRTVTLAGEDELAALMPSLAQPLLLVLDSITDPHNLGACLRTADAAGVDAVVIPRDKSVGLTPTVRKVASGAAEHIPVFAVTNLARCLDRLKEQGVWVIGTAGEAQQGLYQTDLTGPVAIVLGAEGSGMRRLTRERCDFLVSIPMAGSVSSLNVSVASGVCVFEALRQRRAVNK